ncbi:GTPase-activating protein RGD2 Ecym_1538 [Eremothecium cymbalariae DBVPG|uniref:Rho-GAP domain-containing protein n=1 Tax=Eremothecium cymbalariae (strain CBS 270.75 / DBVPG 7215 / KCTC 17166 / NRRL Y-17582) TaxID=931890 RepID=G8JMU3_ERECY|nr:hypothetical protein Ecym_1538 [Eremothecium cymbalariae DBVPG\
MPSFADSFWTDDSSTGVQTLFAQLHEGCNQNDLFIQLFASRMQYEVVYGRQLCNMRSGIDKFDAQKSTISNALNEIIDQMVQEGNHHLTIASNIEATVLTPFSKWSEEHRQRIEYSEKILNKSLTKFGKSKKYVEKLEQTYFNKCRALEDFKREQFNEDDLASAMEALQLQKEHDKTVAKEREFQEFGTFGSISLDYKSTREILHALLTQLEKQEYKVPLINYIIPNTNNGSEIVKFLLQHMSLKDLDQAEAFGQDLLNKGFLKYCNGVGTSFINSKKFQYQWKAYAYEFARVSQPGTELEDISGDNTSESGFSNSVISNEPSRFSAYFHDITSRITSSEPSQEMTKYNDASSPSSNLQSPLLTEQQRTLLKLFNDVDIADAKYRHECMKMDSLRCSVEELIVDHYTFMEKCENDRLVAVKKVTLDFCATLGNKISSMKIAVERMIASENSMDPGADILNLVEKYRTGVFQPKVIPYNNYYNPGGYQVFGIDLESRCRLDKKTVPIIVSTLLSYMDQIYPEMENDNERTTVWTVPVKLQSTHQLRKLLNDRPFKNEEEIFNIIKDCKAEPSLVASLLKIYLLELPTPLISDNIYDVMKSLYSEFPPVPNEGVTSHGQETIDKHRIQGLIHTLSTLSKPRVATLDAITNHFYRLIKILKMSELEASQALADDLAIRISQEFANCIIQVKLPDGNDLGYKIFYDLLTYKKQIFKDLKGHGSRSNKSTHSNKDNDSQ